MFQSSICQYQLSSSFPLQLLCIARVFAFQFPPSSSSLRRIFPMADEMPTSVPGWPHSIKCRLWCNSNVRSLPMFSKRAEKREGIVYFLCRAPTGTKGSLWVTFVEPFVCHGHLLESKFVYGTSLDTSQAVSLHEDSDKKDLIFYWPLAGDLPRESRRHMHTPVHRILGFTLLYAVQDWNGCPAYNGLLDVHHLDDVHKNSLVANLRIMWHSEHSREHKRKRDR